MANSKINQSELSYSCSTGQAKVNLFTGRLLFNHPDISIGIGSYQILISHIYNSELVLPTGINTIFGQKWKLNIEQYVYKEYDPNTEKDIYIYIDTLGYRHEFHELDYGEPVKTRFYDTSGLGLTLTVNLANIVITDEANNKMVFENGRLIKTVSTENEQMIKYFDHDSSGRLISVYDGRKSENNLSFSYDPSTNLLKRITCKRNSKVIEEIDYYYDSRKCIDKITRTVEGITKIDSLFSYYGVSLAYAVGYEDNSAIRFSYLNSKVSMVATGVATLTPQSKIEQALYVGDDNYLGEELFLGETETIDSFIISGVNSLGLDKISQNDIVYSGNYTTVANENRVNMVYYFNEKGYNTSVLEAHNEDINDLKTLQKSQGILMLNDPNTENYFNQQSITSISSRVIDTSSLLSERFEEVKNYRKKYSNYNNFICSFWLKLGAKLKNNKIIIRIWSIGSEYTSDISYKSFDNSAVGSWQFISIPIHITNQEIESIHIIIQEESMDYGIVDMRLCYNPTSRVYISNGAESIPLDNTTCIKYTTPLNPNIEESIDLNNDSFITEIDLQLTYLSRFKARGLVATGSSFILSYCNGTKKKVVNSVKLCVDENKDSIPEKYFPLVFHNIQNQEGGRCIFFHEIKSPDGNLVTKNYLYYLKNKDFEGLAYDCLRQVTEATKTISGNNTIVSGMETYSDLKGKVLKEVDEYGVETIYGYDTFGNVSKKILRSSDKLEQISFSQDNYDSYTVNKDYKSSVRTNYDETLGHVKSTTYQGIGEDINKMLTTNYSYDNSNSKLIGIENNIGGSNYLNYCSGRIQWVSPTNWNDSNPYGYKMGYNNLGELKKYSLTYKEANEIKEEVLIERNFDRSNNKIVTWKYRDYLSDATVQQLDKYDRTTSINEGSNSTTFTRQNVKESSGSSLVTEMYDPYENKTYVYSYDDFNNITGYEIKEGSSTGSTFLSIIPSKDNEIKYKLTHSTGEYSFRTIVSKQDDKLYNPLIISTRTIMDVLDYTTNYTYDGLGRINVKATDLYEVGNVCSTFTEEKNYKRNTLLIEHEQSVLNSFNAERIEIDFHYSYNERGNIIANELIQKNDGLQSKSSISIYSYDKASRLLREEKSILGNPSNSYTKTYTYNNDGSIKTESDGTLTKTYVYQKGRLAYIYDNTPQENTTQFLYDNLGNCTYYMINSTSSARMDWFRGNLLKELHGNISSYYSYNSQGIRIKKQDSSGNITTYYLDGQKLIGEDRSDGKRIRYFYDLEGIKGFKFENDANVYLFIKDVIGNIVTIFDKNRVVAQYEYDAWGKCTITKDINGIGTLNPIRWKSQYYDQESGLYYMGGRYYSPAMKSFISPCNFDEILYNIDVPGNLNAYSIGNPMYFPINGYNIKSNVLNNGGDYGSVILKGNKLDLPKIPEFAGYIKDTINIGYASASAIQTGYWVYNNLSFFYDMKMIGVGRTRAINELAGTFDGLSFADKIFIGFDVGLDLYDSIQSGVSFGGTVVGAGLTLVKGIGMVYASKGIILTITAVGSMFGPIGTVVGFMIGVGVAIYFDFKVGKWIDEQIGKIKRLI